MTWALKDGHNSISKLAMCVSTPKYILHSTWLKDLFITRMMYTICPLILAIKTAMVMDCVLLEDVLAKMDCMASVVHLLTAKTHYVLLILIPLIPKFVIIANKMVSATMAYVHAYLTT